MRLPESAPRRRSSLLQTVIALVVLICLMAASTAVAQQADAPTAGAKSAQSFLNLRDMLAAGGAIGYVIMFLSFIMVALVIDYMLNLRKQSFMPPGLAEEVHRCLAEKKIPDAIK
ncbi:MAG: hypothetical protein ACK58L_17320, partial [Planctomycetota bacterium]